MTSSFRQAAFGLFLVFCLASASGQPPAADEPRTMVKSFYSWYIAHFIKDQDPLHNDSKTVARYVSAELVKEIEGKIHSPDGLEADYFLQAQDYQDDWAGNISVSASHIAGLAATNDVILGATPATLQRLRIRLINESGTWRIRTVSQD